MATLAQIPKEERPRERFLHLGDEALSLTELLAICLGNGRKGCSVLSLAEELLARFGSLANLCEASVQALTEVKGIGLSKAIQLKAVLALTKRIHKVAGKAKYPVSSHEDVYHFIAPKLQKEQRELFAVMIRDVKGNIVHDEILAVGTLTEVLIHPREIFHLAMHHRAYSIIVAHNHPSGDPTPSKVDIELTKLLKTSGKFLGIPLDDHLIIGQFSYVSLREEGLL